MALTKKTEPLKIPSQKYSSTLERGMRVLRAFQSTDNGLSNQELAVRTGIPKSTISRLTFTLQELGFLCHAERNDKFRPGPGLLALGRVASDAMPFVQRCAPTLQRLADETSSLIMMSAREGVALMIISAVRPGGRVIRKFDVGHSIPMVGSSAGHAFLAVMPDADFDALLPALTLEYDVEEKDVRAIRSLAQTDLAERGFHQAPRDGYFDVRIKAIALPLYSKALASPVMVSGLVWHSSKTDEEMSEVLGPRIALEMSGLDAELSLIVPELEP